MKLTVKELLEQNREKLESEDEARVALELKEGNRNGETEKEST